MCPWCPPTAAACAGLAGSGDAPTDPSLAPSAPLGVWEGSGLSAVSGCAPCTTPTVSAPCWGARRARCLPCSLGSWDAHPGAARPASGHRGSSGASAGSPTLPPAALRRLLSPHLGRQAPRQLLGATCTAARCPRQAAAAANFMGRRRAVPAQPGQALEQHLAQALELAPGLASATLASHAGLLIGVGRVALHSQEALRQSLPGMRPAHQLLG